jgi:hypothetical protein
MFFFVILSIAQDSFQFEFNIRLSGCAARQVARAAVPPDRLPTSRGVEIGVAEPQLPAPRGASRMSIIQVTWYENGPALVRQLSNSA